MANRPTLADSYPTQDALWLEMGEPSSEFRPQRWKIIVKLVFFTFLLVLGIGMVGMTGYLLVTEPADLPPGMGKRPDGVKLVIGLVKGCLLTFFGGFYLLHTWPRRLDRILVYPDGFVHAAQQINVYRWEDVEVIYHDPVDPKKQWPGDGPPMMRGTSILVRHKNGNQFGFDQDSLNSHRQFARILYAAAQSHGIPWEVYLAR